MSSTKTRNGAFHWLASAIAVFVCTLSSGASGQFIAGVSILNGTPGNFGRDLIDLTSGSGLTDSGGVFVDDDNPNNMWLADLSQNPTPFVSLDLGGLYNLSSMDIWNYNEFTNMRGFRDVTVSVGATSGSVMPLNNAFTFAIADGQPGLESQMIDLSAFPEADAVRIVRFDMVNNHGDTSWAGLSEVRFTGTLVPLVDGDVTGEGDVNLADFQIISNNMLLDVTSRSQGDLNGDGRVTFADYREWKDVVDAQPGSLVSAVSAQVPEPATSTMAVFAAVVTGLLALRSKSRRTIQA